MSSASVRFMQVSVPVSSSGVRCQCPVQQSSSSDVIQPQHVWHRGKTYDFKLVVFHTSLAMIAQTQVAFLHDSRACFAMKRQPSSIRAFGGKHQRLARALPMGALASQASGNGEPVLVGGLTVAPLDGDDEVDVLLELWSLGLMSAILLRPPPKQLARWRRGQPWRLWLASVHWATSRPTRAVTCGGSLISGTWTLPPPSLTGLRYPVMLLHEFLRILGPQPLSEF